MQDEGIDHLLKIIIIGDTGVGKTNLLKRYTRNEFSDVFKNTIGVDFSTMDMRIKDKNVKIQFWDTAG